MEVDDRLIVLILGWPGTGIIDTEIKVEGDKASTPKQFRGQIKCKGL